MRLTRFRLAALGVAVAAGVTAGVAAPAVGTDDSRSRTLTFYEVSDGVIITDETPNRITITPGQPPSVTPLTNPVQGASGVGDELIIDSKLYGAATFVNVPQLPPFLPAAAVRSQITVPWRTFQPAGPQVGDVLGVCTFVRADLELAAGPPNSAPPVRDRREASCELTIKIPQGQIVAGGILDVTALEDARPATLAITGGTGAFGRAHGTVTLQQPSVPAFDRFTVTVDYRS